MVQLHGDGQTGLPAQASQQAVRLGFQNDPLDGFRGQGLQVDRVGDGVVGHDGGGVGVDQDDLQALLLQRAAGLGACVVKFGGLADDDGAGADHQYLLDGCILRHYKPSFIIAVKRSNAVRQS